MSSNDSWDEADLSPAGALPSIPEVTLLRELARGGMGIVYRGRQDFLERDVAVKVLAPELHGESFAARFRREAMLLAGIKHPHIVACYAAGVTTIGQHYLVMELVEGPTLERWVSQNGPAPLRAALRLTAQLAGALGHACELGVIHRDVKTANVLLEAPTGTLLDPHFPFVPKLVDLGLARLIAGSTDLARTAPGSVMGTPATMAPEQFDAPDSVDYRADIYGLGCVLFELLTGSPAFPSQRLTELVVQKRRPRGPDPCELVPSLPAEVGELVAGMLAHDPADRPRDYRTLRARLDDLGKDVLSNMMTRPSPVRPSKAAPPADENENLLRTAEFEFLAKDHDPARRGAAAFTSRIEAPKGSIANSPAAASADVPARTLVAPRVVGARHAAAARSRRGGRLALVAGLLVVATAGVAVPWWHGGDDGAKPMAVAPATSAGAGVGDVGADATGGQRSAVELLGLDGPLRRGARLSLRSRVDDVDGVDLKYRWSVEPADAVVLETPAEAATAMRHELLPGDALTLRLLVGDAPDQTATEQRVVVRYPSSDLLADFFDPAGAWQTGGLLASSWQRDGEGVVVQAGEVTRVAARPLSGAVWRVAGTMLPADEDPPEPIPIDERTFETSAPDARPSVVQPVSPQSRGTARPGTSGPDLRGREQSWPPPPPRDSEGLRPPPRGAEGQPAPAGRGPAPRERRGPVRREPRRPGPNATALTEVAVQYGQAAIALRVGPRRQLALVCERSGVEGEHWTLSLRELVRDDSATGLVLRPLANATVSSLETDWARGAAFMITRRGAELVLQFGFVDRPERGEYVEVLSEAPSEMPFRLLARSGRVMFSGLQLW
ncbi:MAG: protein kinase [Planctomycetota bacterium]